MPTKKLSTLNSTHLDSLVKKWDIWTQFRGTCTSAAEVSPLQARVTSAKSLITPNTLSSSVSQEHHFTNHHPISLPSANWASWTGLMISGVTMWPKLSIQNNYLLCCPSRGSHRVSAAPWHCTALHCTALHCTDLTCTALHCTAASKASNGYHGTKSSPQQTGTVWNCTALHCTALHCTALHCTALHCTALHCTALHCTALSVTNCTALHCTVPSAIKASNGYQTRNEKHSPANWNCL
jgi:hypothetical protein